ncbi:MAG: polymerase, sigma-24 subunit, subfamily [Dehalococcoidia bacterium]|nr:polymerase, sigma-24 subunit, subfamily [Dehalococcoidia bacterium]
MTASSLPDDSDLVHRSQRGDLGSFNLLVERYQGRVFNLALRMLGNSQGADDATQDAFISAYRGIGRFRGGSFRAWILRITANACYDALRAVKRRPTVPLEVVDTSPQDLPGSSAPPESPEEYALRQELSRSLQVALSRLPSEQRLVVVLSDIQGYSYEEIAQITRSSLGTVKSRLNRGRSKVREYVLQSRELFPEYQRLISSEEKGAPGEQDR